MATVLPVSAEDVEEAAGALRRYLTVTPLQQSFALTEKAGCPVFLKIETTQPTRSFKVRGALNRVLHLGTEERRAGVVSASAGNHGQGVAYAARTFGIPATVYVPVGANEGKVASMRRLGARVVEHGRTFNDANLEALREAARTGAAFVHAYDDPDVVAGQGTVGLELLEQLPDLDTVICPIGGGGLISGLALHLKTRRPDVRIVGVEPAGAAAMHASHRAGRIVMLDRIDTMADGLAASTPSALTFAIAEAFVDELVLVEEPELLRAVRVLMQWEHLLVEPGGAAATAALLYRYRPRAGERIAVLVSGANVADQVLVQALRTR
ncbi:MAG: threonine/serine dehydratase [Candidatus Dormibacteraeota bacterium]|nr:threonine/serine dehydratase [Candidatus Dormibacteraeota bacterium]MBO0743390.1 threonine/serine dehydratase [Candidatus Dormibacteraeota bacterium]